MACLGANQPLWADGRAPATRQTRHAAFKASLSTNQWRMRQRFVPRAGQRKPPQPGIRIKSLGQVMMLRVVSPARVDGAQGVKVRDFVKLRPAGSRNPNQVLAGKALAESLKLTEQRFALAKVERGALVKAAVKGVLQSKAVNSRDGYRAAMSKLAASLGDKYSSYFPPEKWQQKQLSTAGKGKGLGVSLSSSPTGVQVSKVQQGSPADGPLKVGDRLVSVAGKQIRSTEDVQRAVTGNLKKATPVKLERQGQLRTVTITPRTFKVQQVGATLKGQGIAAVKLARFTKGSADQVSQAIGRLKQQNNGQLRGVVLDLRGNPGGLTAEAQALINLFIPRGDLFFFARNNKVLKRHAADPAKAPFEQLPLAVLVDGKSASSSEIVAGALKYRQRATLVGEKTFGKGIAQSQFNLPDGSGLKLTSFNIGLAMEGRSTMALYHGKGLTPDVKVRQARDGRDAAMERALGLLQ